MNFKSLMASSIFSSLILMSVGAEKSEAQEVSLSYAFFAPNGTFPAKQMNHWAGELESRTDGMVEVKTFPGGTLLGAKDMYNGVTHGLVDIGLGSPAGDPGRFPVSSVMSLPLGITSATKGSQVYHGLIEKLKPKEMEGFKVIALFTSEPVHIQLRNEPEDLDSLNSIKLGGSGSLMPAVSALEGSPVAMLMPSIMEALPTGVIDGVVTSREVLKDFNLSEHINYVVDYPMGVISFAAVMTEKKWNSLPVEVQQVIEELALEMPLWTGNYHDNAVEDAIQWSEDSHGLSHIELEEEEKAAWDQSLLSLVESWEAEMKKKGIDSKEVLNHVRKLIEEDNNI